MSNDHAQLLDLIRPHCARYALALAGADALAAHGFEVSPSSELLLVTAEDTPLAAVAAALAGGLRAAGLSVQAEPGSGTAVRLSGGPCPIELRKEPLRHPTLVLDGPFFPVIALEDAAGLCVLDLCDRALPGDLANLHALSAGFSQGELLANAAALTEDFQAQTLAERLETAAGLWSGDEEVARWAESWAADLRLDLLETQELTDGLHDPYLEDEEEPDDL